MLYFRFINESKIYSNLVSTSMTVTKPTFSIEENDETPKFLLFGPSVSFDREIAIFVAIAIFLFFILTCTTCRVRQKRSNITNVVRSKEGKRKYWK